jgi:hypothetical protein
MVVGGKEGEREVGVKEGERGEGPGIGREGSWCSVITFTC